MRILLILTLILINTGATYLHPESAFRLRYPLSWSLYRNYQGQGLDILKGPRGAKFQVVEIGRSHFPAQEVDKLEAALLKGMPPDAEIFSGVLGRHRCRTLVQKLPLDPPLTFWQFLVVHKDEVYFLACSYVGEGEMPSECREILESLEFLEFAVEGR